MTAVWEQQAAALTSIDSRPIWEILEEKQMPLPLWAKRNYDRTGEDACPAVLSAAEARAAIPCCVYVHIPYCPSKCGYCDCYAFPLIPSRRPELARYADALCREIELWGELCPTSKRPQITTVHFGGGTPLTLGADGLRRVVTALRSTLNMDESTELALESTTGLLDRGVLDALREIGFTRLHIGVQSLNDAVRKDIGRRESGTIVLEKISMAIRSGWIVSTDVITGLPKLQPEMIIDDIHREADLGVEGFSIYELVHSPRNDPWFRYHHLDEMDIVDLYIQYQEAFKCARDIGYSLCIYNHMAKGRDDNRYFSSPLRGEDLLSFGTISDGYFGGTLYKHRELPGYFADLEAGKLPYVGALTRTAKESDYARLERELRSGTPAPEPFIELLGTETALDLFRSWFSRGFIRTDADFSRCELEANGSWFINRMLSETGMLMED